MDTVLVCPARRDISNRIFIHLRLSLCYAHTILPVWGFARIYGMKVFVRVAWEIHHVRRH